MKKNNKKQHKRSVGKSVTKHSTPKFTQKELTDENITDFLQVFPEQERLFALEYSRTWNAKAAYQKIHPQAKDSTAKNAGYKFLQRHKIQLYLDYMAKQRSRKYNVTEEQIMRELDQVTQQSLAAVAVYGSDGKPTGEFTFNAAGANKSIELKGKQIGMFINKVQIDDGRQTQIIVHHHVVPEIRSIDMADPNYQLEINKAVERAIVERREKN